MKETSSREFLALSAAALASAGLGAQAPDRRLFAYVGRRTKGPGFGVGGGGGITVFRVNMTDGSLTEVGKTGADLDDLNSDGMCVSADGRFLYSVIQTPSLGGKPGAGGGVAAFAISREDGSLKHLNTQPSMGDPGWTPEKRPINVGADVVAAERTAAPITADNPDLSAFFARGGRLIQVHGLTDPLIAPGDSIDYYTRVRAKVGEPVANGSMRLYLVPGMNHCQGGEGADTINMQPVIEAWVERTQAPATVIASKVVNGQTQKTHLLCPYPQEAVLKGSGSPDDAASFECRIR